MHTHTQTDEYYYVILMSLVIVFGPVLETSYHRNQQAKIMLQTGTYSCICLTFHTQVQRKYCYDDGEE